MATRLGRTGVRTLAGALVVTAPVIAACSSGPTYDQWAATDGAAGRINLDDVQEAFKKSSSATVFESKVNEIYEGDGIVLIRSRQDGDRLTLEGWEDLNGNFEIDDASDDKLFDIVEEDERHQMRGYGGNSYYNQGFGAGNFLFTYMLISAISPRGYYYSTPPTYARTTLSRGRASYRSGSRYRSQVSRNSSYFTRQKSFAGSRYDAAGKNLSTSRQSYQQRSRTSGAFKASSTGVRSSWGFVQPLGRIPRREPRWFSRRRRRDDDNRVAQKPRRLKTGGPPTRRYRRRTAASDSASPNRWRAEAINVQTNIRDL